MLKLSKAGLIGTVVGAIGVAITFLIADAVSGPLMATSVGADVAEEVPMVAAVGGAVFGGIIGIILAAISKQFLGAKAASVFVGICVVALVAFGALSFSATEEISAGIWLNVMHIVAAVPIVGLLAQNLADEV